MPAPLTKYMELVTKMGAPDFDYPVGPGYAVVFDKTVATKGYREIRVWVHIFITNYETTPVTSSAKLNVRFMHQFGQGNSFDFAQTELGWNGVTSYIDGYAAQRIIGDKTRIMCHPTNLPAGPYDIFVTCYLVR